MVTGATGMVGGNLVGELLRESDYTLVLPVRNRNRLDRLWKTLSMNGITNPEQVYGNRLIVEECSLNDRLRLREIMQGVDQVFHCAASVSLGKGDNIVANNVEITSNMVDTALECGVDLFVHISSIASLGASTPSKPLIDETVDMETTEGHSEYSVSKFLSENQVKRGAQFGLRTIVVNPAIILGEGEWGGTGSSAIIPTLSKGTPAAPSGVTAYVDVRDVARAMRLLSLEDKAVGERFVLAAENLSFRQLATLAAKAAGRPAPFFTVGKVAVSIVHAATSFFAFLTGTENRFSRSIARNAIAKNYYDGSKITRYTKFRYTPVKDTVQRIVAQYKKDRRS